MGATVGELLFQVKVTPLRTLPRESLAVAVKVVLVLTMIEEEDEVTLIEASMGGAEFELQPARKIVTMAKRPSGTDRENARRPRCVCCDVNCDNWRSSMQTDTTKGNEGSPGMTPPNGMDSLAA